MTIKPIETEYADCRFRSRLEARWAVFFDHLGVRWEYEPQGFEIGESKRRYLPDFHLPELEAWVEVKGDHEALDLSLLADAVEGPCQLVMLILGNMPKLEVGAVPTHSMLAPVFDIRYPQADHSLARRFFETIQALDAEGQRIANDMVMSQSGGPVVALQQFIFVPHKERPGFWPVGLAGTPPVDLAQVLEPKPVWTVWPTAAVRDAYKAARSARFEHGETPDRPTSVEGEQPRVEHPSLDKYVRQSDWYRRAQQRREADEEAAGDTPDE